MPWNRRFVTLLALAIAPGLFVVGCRSNEADARATAPSADAGSDLDADYGAPEGPPWLGDAGVLARAPVPRPLHALCGMGVVLPGGSDDGSQAARKDALDAVADLGIGFVRHEFFWQDIEGTKGTFDFAASDRVLDDALAHGIQILGLLDYGTLWANPNAKDPYYPPSDPADFAHFAATTAQHFHHRVLAWEIWNEPNNGFRFWKGTLSGDPVGYGTLLSAAHDAIRSVEPDAPVMLAGTVFTPQLIEGAMPWLQKAYAARPDLASDFEIAGAHTYMAYPPQTPPENGLAMDAPLESKLGMHSWLLAQHGGASKPIWITEIGWPVYGDVDEAAQARFTVRAMILAANAGAEAVTFYTLQDGPHPEAFPPEDAFGLLRNDKTKKPAYLALKFLLATVGERWPVASPSPFTGTLPPDLHVVTFGAPGQPSLVTAWTVDTPSASLSVNRSMKVTQELGTAANDVEPGGTITITPDVTYLELL